MFQVVLVLVLLAVAGLTGCAKAQEEVSPSEPSMPQEVFLDSDGDGFNDWFETNIAHYDSTVPNDRYVIRFYRLEENPSGVDMASDPEYRFFIEKGGVPPENLIFLNQEEATGPNLGNTIEQVAEKSDKNDLVFLRILAHGGPASFSGFGGNVEYTVLDEWLDKIEAKAVVVVIMACGCEAALPVLKDGPCPRIVFIHSAGEFIRGLGEDPSYAIDADTKYGNGDGYISVGEIGSWIDNNPFWGPDWGELYEEGRSFVEAEGYSKMSDTSNIAYQIYLTDYTPYDIPPVLRISQANTP